MEIEPEVIPPQGRTRGPQPFADRPLWQSVLAAVAGLAVLLLIAWLAFWVALVLIGLALMGWVVRKLVFLFTGRSGGGGSGVDIIIHRGPRP
jgi:hypothetical protein